VNLHQLRVFCTVAQHRSIVKAAGALLLTQPAVSLHVKALEKELGLPLFARGGPGLGLTQAGDVLYRSAVSMLSAKEEAERAISELRDGTRGRLILGGGTTGGMYVLPRILQAYRRLWPETEIVFHTGTTDQLLDKLLQNVLDMAVVGGPIEDRRFGVDFLCAEKLVLIAAPTHPIGGLGRATLGDLNGVAFIVPETGSRTRQLVERKLRDAGVSLKIAMQLQGTEGVKKAVEAGLGVGIVSPFAIEAETVTGVLRVVPVVGMTLTRPVNLVYRTQKYFSPVCQRFREFAKSFGAEQLARASAQTELPATAGRPRRPGRRRLPRRLRPR
jgi:DNA-binding transcriptional LysR family regulator